MSPKTPPWSSLSQEFNNLNDQKIKYETTKVLFIKNYNLKNPSGSHLLDLGWPMEGLRLAHDMGHGLDSPPG